MGGIVLLETCNHSFAVRLASQRPSFVIQLRHHPRVLKVLVIGHLEDRVFANLEKVTAVIRDVERMIGSFTLAVQLDRLTIILGPARVLYRLLAQQVLFLLDFVHSLDLLIGLLKITCLLER